MAGLKMIGSVVMVLVVIASPAAEAAITCSSVTSKLTPCISYLQKGGGVPPPTCCDGIKSLNAEATTTPDRQTACQCLKAAANSLRGSVNIGLASGLPSKCGVSIPYKISPSTDCSTVK